MVSEGPNERVIRPRCEGPIRSTDVFCCNFHISRLVFLLLVLLLATTSVLRHFRHRLLIAGVLSAENWSPTAWVAVVVHPANALAYPTTCWSFFHAPLHFLNIPHPHNTHCCFCYFPGSSQLVFILPSLLDYHTTPSPLSVALVIFFVFPLLWVDQSCPDVLP